MAKTAKSGNAWYEFKNITMAIAFLVLAGFTGPLSAMVGIVAVFVLGISMIIRGICSIGETNLGVSVAVIVLGGAVIGVAVQLTHYDWFNKASACLSAAFIAWLGFRQRKKVKEPYGINTRYQHRLRVLANLLFVFIFYGGLVIFAATILDFFNIYRLFVMYDRFVSMAKSYFCCYESLERKQRHNKRF